MEQMHSSRDTLKLASVKARDCGCDLRRPDASRTMCEAEVRTERDVEASGGEQAIRESYWEFWLMGAIIAAAFVNAAIQVLS